LGRADHFAPFGTGLEPAVEERADRGGPRRKSEGFNGFLETNFRFR